MPNFRSIYLLLLVYLPLRVSAQISLIAKLNQIITPIKIQSQQNEFSDIQPLKDAFLNAKIIGMGEATHGTKEFFLYKIRLFKFLVTKMGFKVFVIEGDFTGAKLVDDYVCNNSGSAFEAIRAVNVGFWVNKDFIDLIEWIRNYNSKVNAEDKIRFYGCDMEYPVTFLNQLIHGSIKFETPLSEDCKKGLILLKNKFNQKFTSSDASLIEKALSEIHDHKPFAVTSKEYQFYTQEVRVIEQYFVYKNTKSSKQHYKIRDQFMAENCKWIFDYENSEKTVVWAHNAHIAKCNTFYNVPSMGYYLVNTFNKKYYSLGLGFNNGTFRAASIPSNGIKKVFTVPPVKIKNSYDFVFSKCNFPNFFLDFKEASKYPQLDEFLNKRLYSRSIGSSYSDAKFAKGKNIHQSMLKLYDGLAFFRTTNAAEPEITKLN